MRRLRGSEGREQGVSSPEQEIADLLERPAKVPEIKEPKAIPVLQPKV